MGSGSHGEPMGWSYGVRDATGGGWGRGATCRVPRDPPGHGPPPRSDATSCPYLRPYSHGGRAGAARPYGILWGGPRGDPKSDGRRWVTGWGGVSMGSLWGLYGVLWVLRGFMGLYGFYGVSIGALWGSIALYGFYGVLWGLYGIYGVQWGFMGSLWGSTGSVGF